MTRNVASSRRAACIFLMAAAGSAGAQTIVLNFDVFPGPDNVLGTADDVPITAPTTFAAQPAQLTSEFGSQGILFTPSPATNDKNEILNRSSFTFPPSSSAPNIFASSGTLTIEGRFTVAVSEVGALLGISGGSDRLEIFDANDVSLGSVVGDDTFQTLQSATPIARFVVSVASGTTPAIDNLTFVVAGGGCYPNCDASTAAPVLNVQDFTCFLQKYAAADGYANCDGSTAAPTLNVADFTCFLQKYAAGCP
jgi:hypothetical protein